MSGAADLMDEAAKKILEDSKPAVLLLKSALDEWLPLRKQTITALEKLADDAATTGNVANGFQLGGAIVSIGSGLLGGAAIIFSAGLATPVAVGLGVAILASTTAVGVAEITKAVHFPKLLDAAQDELGKELDQYQTVIKACADLHECVTDQSEFQESSKWYDWLYMPYMSAQLAYGMLQDSKKIYELLSSASNAAKGTSEVVVSEMGKAALKTSEKAATRAAGTAATKAAGKAAGKGATRAAGKAATKAAGKGATRAAVKAAGKGATRAVGKAATKAASKGATRAAGKAAIRAAGKGATRAVGKAATKATAKVATKATAKVATKAVGKAATEVTAKAMVKTSTEVTTAVSKAVALPATKSAGKRALKLVPLLQVVTIVLDAKAAYSAGKELVGGTEAECKLRKKVESLKKEVTDLLIPIYNGYARRLNWSLYDTPKL